MLWKCHAQSRLLGISAQRCVLRSGITGQELLLASCSEKLLPVSCSSWCCFTRCRVIKGVRSGIRGYVCVVPKRERVRGATLCLTNVFSYLLHHGSMQRQKRCVHVSSGFAILTKVRGKRNVLTAAWRNSTLVGQFRVLARDGRCGSATHARLGQQFLQFVFWCESVQGGPATCVGARECSNSCWIKYATLAVTVQSRTVETATVVSVRGK